MNDAQFGFKTGDLEAIIKILTGFSTLKKAVLFGSRAKGTAKRFSDLDLAIDIGTPLSLALISKISDEFEESILPYKVDLIDWQTTSDEFKKMVEKDKVVI